MDDVTRSIMKSEEKGDYYKDASDWYAYRYVYPFTERSILIVLATIMALSLLINFTTITGIHPIHQEIPFMIQTDDSIDSILKIKGIGHTFQRMHDAVAAYILERYVIAYESYEYQNLKDQLQYIYNTSSQQVYSDFYANMALENPQSPIQLYQRVARRNVTIESVEFPRDIKHPDRTIVRFKAEVENYRTNSHDTTRWEAHIRFNVPDIEKIAREKTIQKIDFIVTSYEVEKISNG